MVPFLGHPVYDVPQHQSRRFDWRAGCNE